MAPGIRPHQGLHCLYRGIEHSALGRKGKFQLLRIGVYGGSPTRPCHCSMVDCVEMDDPSGSHVVSRRHAGSPFSMRLFRSP